MTAQETRNAIYSGEWLTDAKRHFSKRGCVAQKIGADYLKGEAIRQEYLETAISWRSGGKIEEYMSEHQHDADAEEMWDYFRSVILWVQKIFPTYRREMKGVEWGNLYNLYKDRSFNAKELEKEVARMMEDDDVSCKKGIYTYLFTGEEKLLNIRSFPLYMKRAAYERQKGVCKHCHEHFTLDEMEADHITPWHLGGRTEPKNCQLLCKACNRAKSGK